MPESKEAIKDTEEKLKGKKRREGKQRSQLEGFSFGQR